VSKSAPKPPNYEPGPSVYQQRPIDPPAMRPDYDQIARRATRRANWNAAILCALVYALAFTVWLINRS
jgi:hypothetical protein